MRFRMNCGPDGKPTAASFLLGDQWVAVRWDAIGELPGHAADRTTEAES